MTTLPLISLRLQYEQDLLAIRQRARQVAALVGFDAQDQTRVATAVSEIARNAYQYAGGGRVEFSIENTGSRQALLVRIADQGPGIPNLQSILQGRYKSHTGMGLGIQGARRLMDQVAINTAPGEGTTVLITKLVPRRAELLGPQRIEAISAELARSQPRDPYDELQSQNQELLRTLDELRHRQEEMAQLNRELEDTNRGVVALYAELDEKAEHLRQADQLKSTFLSHMSHEFRTPLNSMMALSQILLTRLDGPLTAEQEKQVGYIHRAAQELTDLVNDLLDLAKVEAGKIELYPSEWKVATLFGTLRGMLRPLLANSPVQLNIEDPLDVPDVFTDEGKVAQIVRNFVSNAIKFTEKGEIQVRCRHESDTGMIAITVTDTGIGIAPEDLARIFDQYVQVSSPRQKRVKGTGLGLPLSKKLAELLGGRIAVESALGVGSSFIFRFPPILPTGEATFEPNPGNVVEVTPRATPRLLIIDDEEIARYLIQKQLSGLNLEIVEAHGGPEGLRLAREQRPDLILLDLAMPELDGFQVLEDLRADPGTAQIPVIIHTSKTVQGEERERLAPRVSAIVRKGDAQSDTLRRTIEQLAHLASNTKVKS